jgi:hypothetical protein
MRINCTYCGNTGTVNGDWCPVCHPRRCRPARRDTWTRHTRRRGQ